MNEVVIRYKNKKVLNVLRDFAKYFDFSIITPDTNLEKDKTVINGVTILSGDSSVDISELKGIFTNRNFDSAKVREELWKRNK